MRSFLVATSVAWLTVFISNRATAQDFRSPPTAVRVKDKIKIEFALTQSTDVEVAVVDAKENVVRHLAAGKLGGANPLPAPLAPISLR